MTVRYWIVIIVITFTIGLVLGTFIRPVRPGGANSTNYSQGTSVLVITNFTQMTNTVSNLTIVWDGFSVLATAPLVYYQHNDKMRSSLAVGTKWQRNFQEITIKSWQVSSGPVIGLGWGILEFAPKVLLGWEFEGTVGVLSTFSISTNFNIDLFAFWKINLF